MVFSTMLFIWVFLPVVFVIDKLAGKKNRIQNVLLLIASLLFYAWGDVRSVGLLLVSIAVNYGAGLLIEKMRDKKGWHQASLIAGIALNLGILGYFKYFNFFANTIDKALRTEAIGMRDIALPLGISFYTFSALTYLIDLYKGKVGAQKNPLHLALYFAFFPKLTQGPIVKYRDFEGQLTERVQTMEKIGAGVRRFIYGLAKKVIIADTLGACVDRVYGLDMGNVNGMFAWVAILFYALQLYYDFSGYSDMAIGLGGMFGFELPENFNYPYIASSVTDFWRRWHISLTSWFREYLYFPLGGNRKGKVRTYVNLGIIFIATGLWHGASWDFICWGMFHGVFMIIERMGLGKILEKTKVIKYLYADLVVCVGWVFFRVGDLGQSLQYIKRMFLPWMYSYSNYALQELVSNRAIFTAVVAVLGCGLIQSVIRKFCPSVEKLKYGVAEMIFCMLLLVYSMMLMVSSTYTSFIYFKF